MTKDKSNNQVKYKSKNDELFFRFWRNIVIREVIFKFSRLYIKNSETKFNNIKTFRKYKQKEFISTLKLEDPPYSRDPRKQKGIITLLPTDFPKYGVLKKLDLSDCKCDIPIDSIREVIPKTVEIISFGRYQSEFKLSELPSSIHTCKSVPFMKPYIDNPIPSNIKTISFRYNDTDPIEFYNLVLPSSITSLSLSFLCNIKEKGLKIEEQPLSTFIPSSVTDLSFWYSYHYKSDLPPIPSTVKKLFLTLEDYTKLVKGIVPFGVEDLTVFEDGENGLEIEGGSIPESVTKLYVNCNSRGDTFEQNSIPSSVTDLTISFGIGRQCSFKSILPTNLIRLNISCSKIHTISPTEITSLRLPRLKYLSLNDKVIFNKK